MGISTADKKQFIEDSQDREIVYMRQVDALFYSVINEVTNDALKFFNNRRYLTEKNERKRARQARSDKGIGGITKKINKLGVDNLKLLSSSIVAHYNNEGPILVDLWNENSPDFFTMTFEDASKSLQKFLLTEDYEGFKYPTYNESQTETAQRTWYRSSVGVMSSNKRQVGKVSPSMQMTADLRNALDTMRKKARSLMNAALSETTRTLIKDTQQAVLAGEIALAKALQKRAQKWA